MILHPKTSAAALAGSAGVLIAAILHSISSVHLTPEVYASIPVFLSTLAAYFAPSPSDPGTPPASSSPVPVASVQPAPAPSAGGGTTTPPIIPTP